MLRQISRLQGHLLRTAKQSYFPAEGNAFNQRDIWYHSSDQSTFALSSNLQTLESCQYETTTQKYLTLDPSSFSPPKSIQINPILYCQKCVFSPLFHGLTYASTRGYSSLQDPLQDQESNQQRELDEIKDIIEMLCDKEKIDKLYDEDGNLMKEGALARKLFQDGISPEELTSLNPQKRFTDAINKQGNLVFYPTEVTVDIFKRILLSKNGLYLSSQTGVGKSFSVALFTFLMRKKPNTRVLYLNNPTTLLGNWSTLRVELEIAFREELKDSNLKQEFKSIFDLKKVDEVIHCLGLFLNNLCEALKHRNIQLFIIIDQVNILDNLEGAKTESDANVFRFYRLFKFFPYANATRVLVSSATNEAVTTGIDQEFPEFTIYPSNVCENTAKKVIADRFNVNIKLKEVEDVYALSGGYFLIIQELAALPVGPRWEKNLEIYKRIKTLQIKDDLERFMSKKDVRKRAMAAVYRALVTEESESNLPTDLFSTDKIDRRHIIYNMGEGKIAPLHPLVLEALKRLFLDSDVQKEMIYLFSNNPVMCGFLFERLMLSHFEHGQTSLSGRSLQKPDQDIVEIISSPSRIHSIVDKRKLNFAMQGFYKPDSSSFPAFDCFISTRDNLYAIQVTKKITKERLTRLITAFQILARDSPSIKDMKKGGKNKAGKDQDQTQNKKKNSSREEILEFKNQPQNDEKTDPIKVKIPKKFLDIVRQVEMQAKVQKKQLKIVVLSLNKKSDQKKFLDYFAKAKIETEFLITDAQPVMIEMGFDQEYIKKLSFSLEHLVHEEHEEEEEEEEEEDEEEEEEVQSEKVEEK